MAPGTPCSGTRGNPAPIVRRIPATITLPCAGGWGSGTCERALPGGVCSMGPVTRRARRAKPSQAASLARQPASLASTAPPSVPSPTSPASASPAEPAAPAAPALPAEPAAPALPAEPAAPALPAEPAVPAEPAAAALPPLPATPSEVSSSEQPIISMITRGAKPQHLKFMTADLARVLGSVHCCSRAALDPVVMNRRQRL